MRVIHYNANRRLMSLSGGATGTFGYNAIGSLTADPSGTTYAYTTLNMLQSSTLGGQTTTYQYGGGGMRAVKTGPDGIPHVFVYGPGGGPIAEYRIVGADVLLEQEYVYVGSQLLTSFRPAPVAMPPLAVTLLTPSDGATISSGQVITLTASASVGGGLTLARVEYYVRGVLIGSTASGPTFSKTWTNTPLPPGSFVFHARLVATNGQAVASQPITLTVQ